MIAYKGFTRDLTARLGRGTYQFVPGETVKEEASQTCRTGFHCCENPFECLNHYSLMCGNRFWQVEAAGSIDEDSEERIACTEMTLIKELSLKELAGHGMTYIIRHPMRAKWRHSGIGICVDEDRAEGDCRDYIAIARGPKPKVKGVEGSILGLILEPEPGNIVSARLFVPDRQQAGRWFTIDAERNPLEVQDEAEGD